MSLSQSHEQMAGMTSWPPHQQPCWPPRRRGRGEAAFRPCRGDPQLGRDTRAPHRGFAPPSRPPRPRRAPTRCPPRRPPHPPLLSSCPGRQRRRGVPGPTCGGRRTPMARAVLRGETEATGAPFFPWIRLPSLGFGRRRG
uniref:Uncharacterized protein n=1 Tax=Arundo donax TaxID=35708 RepID=A0A0A9AAB4_ARUDO